MHNDADLTVAALEAVGGQAGGAPRPLGEYRAVALALADLHSATADLAAFPQLDEHLSTVVLPRIDTRLGTVGGDVPDRCLEAIAQLDLDPRRPVLLHTDLYRENVLFDADQRPVLIDPLPMVGDPAYDWAFWVVYYDLLSDPVTRLRIAAAIGDIPPEDLLPSCLTLCVDGLLYYREAGDRRASRMVDVMVALVACMRESAPC